MAYRQGCSAYNEDWGNRIPLEGGDTLQKQVHPMAGSWSYVKSHKISHGFVMVRQVNPNLPGDGIPFL